MISLEDVNMSFGPKKVFVNFNCTFEEGKIYCILGKSGCGKSTMLRIIAGLQKVDSGSVQMNGRPVHRAMKELYMMHQKYVNFPWKTVMNNVLLPLRLNDGKIDTAEREAATAMLAEVGLPDCGNLYPHELSGGMNQRVALARVLVAKPKILLMDEPLSALDPNTRTLMQDLVLKLHRETGNTILLVTHDPAEAQRLQDVTIQL